MAIFSASPPAYQATGSIGSGAAVQIYNTTSITIGSTTYTFPTGAPLANLTVVNTGTVTAYIGSSSVTAATGLALAAGQQLTIQGSVIAGSSVWNFYAITSSGTTSVEVSLGSVVSVV